MSQQTLSRIVPGVLAAGLIAWPAALFAQAVLAEPQTPVRFAESIEFASTLIEAVMEESGTPGMSVAVGIAGDLVWAEGFGYADVESRVPVWEETRFRIGSVSKPLTAAAVGLLVQEGRLDLDAPVQQYVTDFPEKRWPISTRQVAGHLAGIRHYRDQEMLSAVRYETVAEGLEIFEEDSLLFQPGERFSYSSYGWNLVSAVVEGASGEDFLPFMQERVFAPLEMTHTVADYTDSIIPHRTRFYQRTSDGLVVNAPYVDNSYKWAGGGFLSTPSDLVRFGIAHFGDDFLRAETIAELWTPQVTRDGESSGYGIGWFVSVEQGAVVRAGHGGGSVGGTAGFETRPPEQAVVALVGNMSQAPTGGVIVDLITEAFLDPEELSSEGAGPDLTGAFECVAVSGRDETLEAIMTLGGPPGGHWGRIEWSDGTVDRVIHRASSPGETRLVTVGEGGSLLSLLFTTSADDGTIDGTWRGGGGGRVNCVRQ